MLHPRSPLTKGTSTELAIKGRGRIREFFALDADKDTLKFYQKKEFFIPTSENELKIVLQTWHDLLALMTVKGSIATEGLSLILEHYDDHYQVIQEMFASIEDFGLTVLVILDYQLQKFFEMVLDMHDVTKASSRQRDFLWRQATEFLEGLENRRPPSVVIPQCLRRTPPAKESRENDNGPAPASKKRRTVKEAGEKAAREKPIATTNKEQQPAWSIPAGKTYMDFFAPGGASEGGWPKLYDARYDREPSMCIRYQVKGACTTRCTLAHVIKSKLSAKDDATITERFKKIYGK
jgi:hypothetical protein